VTDEVSNALWYLEDRLLEAASRVRERLVQAFEDEFGGGLAAVTPLSMGSWVGGDRDGNPFVTAEITLAAARSARRAVLAYYARLWLTSRGGSPYPSGSLRSRPSCEPRSSGTARSCRACGSRIAAATRRAPPPESQLHAGRVEADPPGTHRRGAGA